MCFYICVCVFRPISCRCLKTCEYFLPSVSSSLPRGVNIILRNHFQTRSPFPHWGIRTVVTCASSLSDVWQFPLWTFKLVSSEGLVFSCWGEVAPHNSIIFALLFIDIQSLLQVFSHWDELFHMNFHDSNYFLLSFSPQSLFCLWGFILSHPSHLHLQRKLWSHLFFMRNLLHAHRCSPKITASLLLVLLGFLFSFWLHIFVIYFYRVFYSVNIETIYFKEWKSLFFMGLLMGPSQVSSVRWESIFSHLL